MITMQLKNLLLLLSSALLVFACSSTKPPEEDTAAASLDLMQKGFLLSLPEEEGWSVVKKGEYKVLLTRTGETGSYTIQSLVVSLPTFEEDEQLDSIEDEEEKEEGEKDPATDEAKEEPEKKEYLFLYVSPKRIVLLEILRN